MFDSHCCPLGSSPAFETVFFGLSVFPAFAAKDLQMEPDERIKWGKGTGDARLQKSWSALVYPAHLALLYLTDGMGNPRVLSISQSSPAPRFGCLVAVTSNASGSKLALTSTDLDGGLANHHPYPPEVAVCP